MTVAGDITSGERMKFLVIEEIGPNQKILQNGFLLCMDVPLARTGTQNYAPGEVPVKPGPNGFIEIVRRDEEVFSPVSMASYSIAEFIDEHSQDDITPQNWRELSHGNVVNVRRGVGEFSDCVMADILVKSPEAIAAVQSGKREVSVGYESDYVQLEPGRAEQRNIIVNHVALVERGRCGPRCAIGDRATVEQKPMTATVTAKKSPAAILFFSSVARLRSLVSAPTRDEAAIGAALEETESAANLIGDSEAPAGGKDPITKDAKTDDEDEDDDKADKKTKDAISNLTKTVDSLVTTVGTMAKTMDSLGKTVATIKTRDEKGDDEEQKKTEDMLSEEAPDGTTKDSIRASTKDSALLEHSFRDTVSGAEILAPGLAVPTFDKALPPAKTFDSICKHRRTALSVAAGQPAMAGFIRDGLKGKTFDSMSCNETRALFRSAVTVKAALNNNQSTRDHSTFVAPVNKTLTIAEVNKRNREAHAPKVIN